MSYQPIEEIAPDVNLAKVTVNEEHTATHRKQNSFKINLRKYWAGLALITYIAGLGSGYMLWGSTMAENDSGGGETASSEHDEMSALFDQVNPPDGYKLPVHYGDFATNFGAKSP